MGNDCGAQRAVGRRARLRQREKLVHALATALDERPHQLIDDERHLVVGGKAHARRVLDGIAELRGIGDAPLHGALERHLHERQ